MSFDTSYTNLIYALPFIGMLLSISFGPLVFPEGWHKNFFKVAIAWSILGIILMLLSFGFWITGAAIIHTLIHEYVPFIIMIGVLYTITGGIHIAIAGQATPYMNVAYLAGGALVASLIGTTGAAMLLIRPLIQINRFRRHKKHLVIFFIIIVANIGGSLSPLGDPPLFLGYLNGVPFLWPLKNLFYPFLIVMVPVLIGFFIVDYYLLSRDPNTVEAKRDLAETKLSITGKVNFILLIGVVFTVALSGSWHDAPTLGFADLTLNELLRDLLLLLLGVLSWQLTSGTARHYNSFSWEPLREVIEVFFAIFITIIPVIAMLQAGVNGPFKGVLHLANPGGAPDNIIYFWLTGALSAFLDNAPTYLVFFHMAGGDVAQLTGSLNATLVALSAGAVFMGALTYIGNAPNFMVRSIAERSHIKMPSFFGYMMWSFAILIPAFVLLTILAF